MKLLTQEIKKSLPALYSTEDIPTAEKVCVVKFFNPMGIGTWYAVEGEPTEDGDYLFFGLVDLHEKEWGYFLLSQIEEVRLPFGLKIERDLYFSGTIPQ